MDLKPSELMKLGGGALMFLGPLLAWYGVSGFDLSGTETRAVGLQGIFILLIGLATASVAALKAFAPQVNLPEQIGGIGLEKLLTIDAIAVVLMCFGALFIGRELSPQIGLFLALIGGGLAVAGGLMPSTDSAPAAPTSF